MPHVFKEQHNCSLLEFYKLDENLKKSQNFKMVIWRKYLADHVNTAVFYTISLTIQLIPEGYINDF